jgi:apolipoprotein D and lipocalin family protein
MTVNSRRLTFSLIALLGVMSGCDSGETLPLAENVDLGGIYGGWYLIATIPNGFEKGLVQPYDVYSKRADGDIGEDFYARRGSVDAPQKHYTVHDWVKPGTHNAHWRVQFGPINVPFLVLYVDPDFRYILFGEQSRNLGWVYSRKPDVPESDFSMLMERFRSVGYDPSRFRKFIQHREQIGKAGFWSDGVRP